jgi:hypothetical protein
VLHWVQVAVMQECGLIEPVSKDVLQHITAVMTAAWQVQALLLVARIAGRMPSFGVSRSSAGCLYRNDTQHTSSPSGSAC